MTFTILFVDDNASIRRFCQQELEDEGYVVVTADNGRQALLLLHQVPADVVVTDLRMPGTGGLETLRQLRLTHPRLPVIVHSAYPETVLEGEAVAAFVAKSADLLSLKQEIVRALQRRITVGADDECDSKEPA